MQDTFELDVIQVGTSLVDDLHLFYPIRNCRGGLIQQIVRHGPTWSLIRLSSGRSTPNSSIGGDIARLLKDDRSSIGRSGTLGGHQ